MQDPSFLANPFMPPARSMPREYGVSAGENDPISRCRLYLYDCAAVAVHNV